MTITKIYVNEKTLQTNIAMNDPYDTRLLDLQFSVTLQCWSEVFYLILPKMLVCHYHYICVFH